MKISASLPAVRRYTPHREKPAASPPDRFEPSLLHKAGRELGRVALIGAGYAGLAAAGAVLGLPGILVAGGAAALGHAAVASQSETLSMTVRLGAAGGVLGMVAATMGGMVGLAGATLPGVALMGVYVASLAGTSRLMECCLR